MKHPTTLRATLFATFLFTGWFCQPRVACSQLAIRPASPPAFVHKGQSEPSKGGSTDEPLSTLYSHGNPTAEEQWVLERINWARAHPDSEGIRLANVTDPYVVSDYQQWQTPTPQQVRYDFATYTPKPPLAFNSSLLTSSTNHSNEMLLVDSMYHFGPDGSPVSRTQAAGYGSQYVGENVGAYDRDLEEDHDGFQIDFGNPGLGHRENIMNFDTTVAFYTEIGIGIIHGGAGWPDVGPIITTEDFGNNAKTFILGVAYTDYNHNNFYDIGEGDSGVKITVIGASYYAVTSGAGGYAIPYSGPNGNVTVTASGGPFPTPVSKTIDFEGQNVKVDFNPDLTGYPTQVSLALPTVDTTVNFDSVTFRWDSVALAQSYHIEIGTDSLFKSAIAKNDSGIKPTYFAFGPLKDSSTYFWRVQAKNAKGLGPWSAVAAFSTAFAPSRVVLISPSNNDNVRDSSVYTFTWQSSNHGTYQYWLIITSGVDTVYQDVTTDTSETVDGSYFHPGGWFYWEVLAQNEVGWSIAGGPWSFNNLVASVAASNLNASPAVVSPNPTNGLAQIRFTLPIAENVSLRWFNSVGDEVKSVALGTRPAGLNEYDFDGSSLATGTYSFELRVGSHTETGRIALIK